MSETIAIIGAGPLGRWLALAAARAGFSVLLEDVMPANLHHAREWLREELGPGSLPGSSLEASTSPNAVPPAPIRSIPNKNEIGITFVSSIEEAVRGADLAIDCVPDELESKLEILWLLDRMAPPRTVLCTPTTRLSIADLAGCTYRPEKCIAIVAEAGDLTGERTAAEILLRATAKTSRESINRATRFWQRLGFTPVFEREDDLCGSK